MSRLLSAVLLTLLLSTSVQAATITILAGTGFNDATPVTAVGGNAATTLGQARLNLFQKAATLWGQKLNSGQTIYVSVDFASLTCSANAALLGQASPRGFYKNFPGTPKSNVYYPEALAFQLANKRLDNSVPTVSNRATAADIIAQFNSAIDGDPSCLHGKGFYYGLDNNPGSKIDLLDTVMHEFGHGLGFISFVDESTGKGSDTSNPNQLGIYDQFVYDESLGAFWTQMSSAQRISSALNTGHLVWNGVLSNGAVSQLTAGVTASGHIELYAPNPDDPGSSVSHWSDVVAPHLLMEPFDSPTLKASLGVDFTVCALADMGWPLAAGISCPDSAGASTNHVPVANSQSLQTNQNTSLPITLTASDSDGDALSYSVVTSPLHGSLSGTAPNLIYVPTTNYSGADSLQFVVNDGKVNSATATIAINVVSSNHAPVASAKSVNVLHDHTVSIVLSGTDADSDPLTFSVVSNPAHGTLTGAVPNLTYHPNTGYNGSDSFTYKANDGKVDSAIATVLIGVIDTAPVASSLMIQTTQNTAKVIALLASDADGDSLAYSVTQPAHGLLTGAAPNLTYTPTNAYSGADNFTFKANDGSADSNVATVSITVTGVATPATNHSPVASDQNVQTAQGTAIAIALTATDVDGDSLSYSYVQPTHGALSGTAPNLIYTPTSGYSGPDSFMFKANDGVVDSNTGVVTINVVPADHPPVANNQTVKAAQDTAVSIALSASDPDGDALTYSFVQPSHGVLSGTAPNLTYTPTSAYHGTDSFTFKANDGSEDSNTATVSIAVDAASGSSGGGGAMPNLCGLLILVGFRRWRALKASKH